MSRRPEVSRKRRPARSSVTAPRRGLLLERGRAAGPASPGRARRRATTLPSAAAAHVDAEVDLLRIHRAKSYQPPIAQPSADRGTAQPPASAAWSAGSASSSSSGIRQVSWAGRATRARARDAPAQRPGRLVHDAAHGRVDELLPQHAQAAVVQRGDAARDRRSPSPSASRRSSRRRAPPSAWRCGRDRRRRARPRRPRSRRRAPDRASCRARRGRGGQVARERLAAAAAADDQHARH